MNGNTSQTQESTAQQQLTTPVVVQTATTVPAMTMEETGEVICSYERGVVEKMASIAEFDNTAILERMVLIHSGTWTISDAFSLTTPLYSVDLMNALYVAARNNAVLTRFKYMRAGVEVTIRLNTNQFFYGAMMATLHLEPISVFAKRIDQRAVLDPTIISASLETSVVKSIDYMFPDAWLQTALLPNVTFNLDVLSPLRQSALNMPDHVEYSVWARYTNVELALPQGSTMADFRPQSSKGSLFDKKKPKVTMPHKKKVALGSVDSSSTSPGGASSSIDDVVSAVSRATIGDIASTAVGLGTFVRDNWQAFIGAASFLLDKPDRAVVQMPMIVEPWTDTYAADLPDSNVVWALHSDRYLTPGPTRMPMSKPWTYLSYAELPGLLTQTISFAALGDASAVTLADTTSWTANDLHTPLDYALLNCSLHRGSIRVCLMFFCASFASARFAVTYGSSTWTDYTDNVSRIIDVKGDTMNCFTVPWVSHRWWETVFGPMPSIRVTMISDIASTDTTTSPLIDLVVWAAAGPDHQFCLPRTLVDDDWSLDAMVPSKTLKRSLRKAVFKPQCSVGSMFDKSFPSMVEGSSFQTDNGYCNTDQIGSIYEVVKRYSPYFNDSAYFFGSTLDNTNTLLPAFLSFRKTFFGAWRSAFHFRSGGYKWRFFDPPDGPQAYFIDSEIPGGTCTGTMYTSGTDSPARITMPQVAYYPYARQGQLNQLAFINGTALASTLNSPALVAARDDVQFGYPVLPNRVQL